MSEPTSSGTPGRAGRPWDLSQLPALAPAALHAHIVAAVNAGARFVGMWGWSTACGRRPFCGPLPLVAADSKVRHAAGTIELVAVVADDAAGRLDACRSTVAVGATVPSLTPAVPAAQVFERQLFESLGIRPEGHPWCKPLLRHAELERGATGTGADAAMHPFFRVDGPGVHEVAVGPVHAGIIEPGHFRFQCAGETVLHLEIQLGYQHRDAEALLLHSRPGRRMVIAESIAGDTVIGHATAYCAALEALSGTAVPARAQAIRAIALELERIANHAGDLGALCGDIGYLPGAAYLGRLRGEFLTLLLELSGNRFGRGLLIPGGVRFDLDDERRTHVGAQLARAHADFENVCELVFSNPSVLSRFEQAGELSHATAERLGMVGPVARASGCARDVRADHPFGLYRFAHIPVARLSDGDVLARALIRHVEARRSIAFVREELERLPSGRLAVEVGPPAADAMVVALVEGWRGEIVHLAVTGARGALCSYQIADPSLHNWFGLAMAMRGQQISDFPLCNKSFNLSYAGHDR
jgi:Ni,Fe-hydrogenase III large subunit